MKKILALVVLAALAVAAWIKWPDSTSARTAGQRAGVADGRLARSDALPPSAALKIDPKLSIAAPGNSTASTRGILPAEVSPLMRRYLSKEDWPALMATLSGVPESGEAAYLRASMLESCATKTDDPTATVPKKPRDERRAAFLATLPANHPDNFARLTAWESVNFVDTCKTIRDMQVTRQEIAELYARAKELSDPAAAARELNCEITATVDPKKNPGVRAAEISDARVERIRAAIASRNPDAVRVGVGMLSNTYRNGAFRFAGDGANVSASAMGHVANLLACQYGADCSSFVNTACYREGKCNVGSYEDYLAFYALSPSDAQTVEIYRHRLTQMIDTNNFSGLQLVKGEQPLDSVHSSSYFSCN